jgi:hypothetical protein
MDPKGLSPWSQKLNMVPHPESVDASTHVCTLLLLQLLGRVACSDSELILKQCVSFRHFDRTPWTEISQHEACTYTQKEMRTSMPERDSNPRTHCLPSDVHVPSFLFATTVPRLVLGPLTFLCNKFGALPPRPLFGFTALPLGTRRTLFFYRFGFGQPLVRIPCHFHGFLHLSSCTE